MTFDTCTFNSSGKTINVYTDFDAGKHDIVVNYKNCKVNGNTPEEKKDKAVMNINDSNMGNYKYIINISGTNVVNGVTPDNLTGSNLFEFNTKYGAGNSGRTVVNVDEVTVWKDGKMVSHANPEDTDPLPPQTGDNSNVSLWMALMLISCGGFAGTFMFKKKKAVK